MSRHAVDLLATFGGSATLTLRPVLGAGGVTISRTDPTLLTSSASRSTTASRTATHVDVVSGATPSASGGSSGTTTTTSSGGSSTPSDTTRVSAFYLQPGATLMLAGGSHFFALNANVLVVPSLSYSGGTTTWLSTGVQAHIGLRW